MRWAWTHKYAVPMFVSSLVAVTLSGSGWIAVMVFDRGGSGGGGGTEIEDCVVGTWEVIEYTENASGGTAEMTRGTPVFTFEDDGTGVADFPADTTIEASIAGIPVEAGVDGQITYEYETTGATFEFISQDSTAEFSSDLNIVGYQDQLTMEGPFGYTCDGDSMTMDGETQALVYRRTG